MSIKKDWLIKMFEQDKKISVGFYGKYIPLQGVEYIVESAVYCPDLSFTLIGNGQTYNEVLRLAEKLELKNIEFIERLPYQKLINKLSEFDILLGIFGDSKKAMSVIPNKVYDAAALGKPIITADSPAIREIFTNGEDIITCQAANAEDLAYHIVLLSKDKNLRQTLGAAALKKVNICCVPDKIAGDLVNDLKKII